MIGGNVARRIEGATASGGKFKAESKRPSPRKLSSEPLLPLDEEAVDMDYGDMAVDVVDGRQESFWRHGDLPFILSQATRPVAEWTQQPNLKKGHWGKTSQQNRLTERASRKAKKQSWVFHHPIQTACLLNCPTAGQKCPPGWLAPIIPFVYDSCYWTATYSQYLAPLGEYQVSLLGKVCSLFKTTVFISGVFCDGILYIDVFSF